MAEPLPFCSSALPLSLVTFSDSTTGVSSSTTFIAGYGGSIVVIPLLMVIENT